MIVRVDDLPADGLPLDFHCESESLSYEGELQIAVEKAHLAGRVYPARDGLVCEGELQALARVPCSRCLEPYPLAVGKSFSVSYLKRPRPDELEKQELKIERDELDVSYLDQQRSFNVNELMAEQIYLDIPMKPLCSDQCRGLCVGCGANLNHEICGCLATA